MQGVLSWLFDFVQGGATALEYIYQPLIDLGDGHVYTILSILSIGGLSIYLAVAIVKWIAS